MEVQYEIGQTKEFCKWMNSQTHRSQAQIHSRLAKIQIEGYFGNYKSVTRNEKGNLKDTVWELKFNDGRRVYYSYIPEKTFYFYWGEIKMAKKKTSIKRKSSTLRIQKGKRVKQVNKTKTKKSVALRSDTGITKLNPVEELLDLDKMGAAIMECFIENDSEGVMEIVEGYLYAHNATKHLKDADFPKTTYYNTLKRRNPTIKTLARLISTVANDHS